MGSMPATARKSVPTAFHEAPVSGQADIRLAVGLQYPLIRAGVRELVANDSTISISGEADSSCALLNVVRNSDANVALVCIKLTGKGYREIIRQLRESRPNVAVLVMSLRFSADLGVDALRHGAAGYISNDREIGEILTAIRTVGAGGRYVAPEIAELLAAELTHPRSTHTRRLSPRENAVLGGLVEGQSHKQIAATLAVSAKSIGTYRSRVLRKLGLRTTADLVRYAVRREG
jgi:two-component system invasion response regulator UvrY